MNWNYKHVYWNDQSQRIRWTSNATFEGYINYEFIGAMTRVEFDLLLEILVELFGDEQITLEEFEMVFGDIRAFCDKIKRVVENEIG